MSRKISVLTLGIVCLTFVLAFAFPASATFTQDTLVLKTNDTSAHLDTLTLIDGAGDSAGNMYILHIDGNGLADSAILITKLDKFGNLSKIITVDSAPSARGGIAGGGGIMKTSLAVNRLSGAIYVAVASDSRAFLYTDTDAPNEDGVDDFDSTEISGYTLLNISDTFGFIDVAVYGTSATDSVFVMAPVDTSLTVSPAPAGTDSATSGIKLWRFKSNGTIGVGDSVFIHPRVDSSGNSVPGNDTQALDHRKIASDAKLVAISANSIAVLLQGVAAQLDSEGIDSRYIGVGVGANYIDTEVDTGLFYDTFQLLHEARLRIVSDTGVDKIVSGITTIAAARAVSAMMWDYTNSRVVIYYKTDSSAGALRRATISGGSRYVSSNDANIGSELSIASNDTDYIAIAAVLDGTGKEHVALRVAKTADTIYYVKRDAGTSATNLLFDTVSVIIGNNLSDSTRLGIFTTSEGSARIIYSRRSNNERYIELAKPQALAVSASSGISVVNSQTVSTTTSPTVTVTPPVTDSTAQMTQVALTAQSTTTKTTTLTTDFATPTYTVAEPLGNASGDTLTLQINSTVSGLAVYTRRYDDTNPSNGNIGSTGNLDTTVFGGLTDTQFTVCAATLIKVRMGDTAGNVFADNAISDTLAIRVRFDLTPSLLASMNAAAIDTRSLTVWKRDNGATKFTQLNNSTDLSSTSLNAGQAVFVVSNTFTSFSDLIVLPAVGAAGGKGGGICLVTRYFDTSSMVSGALRQVRDSILSSKVGRVLTSIYYSLN